MWSKLNSREQTVLRAMAETVKPELETEIGSYVSGQMNYNKFFKAMNALRALNLVVTKRLANGPELLEFHPLVRQFIRRRFAAHERKSFIEAIVNTYQRFIAKHRSNLSERPTLSLLEYWTQATELDIMAGRTQEAVETLAESAPAFESSAYPREFCRTARLLLSSFDWVQDHAKFRKLDVVLITLAETLSYLGEYIEVDRLLEQYERTLPNEDAGTFATAGCKVPLIGCGPTFRPPSDGATLGKSFSSPPMLTQATTYPIN
jgi:hypothetical protein